jgi:hypothetical protein
MFGSWLYGIKKELRSLVLLGAGVIDWSIWLHRNDIVFEKKKNYSPLQAICIATHRLRSSDILQRSDMQGIAVGPVHPAYNPYFSTYFSAETMFFSHNKSVNSVF